MDKRNLTRLEYNKVLERLSGFAVSPLGRELALSLQPVTQIELILRWQSEVTEALEMLRMEPSAEIGGWYDVRDSIRHAGRGVLLEPEDLMAVGRTLTAARKLKKFLGDRGEKYPLLFDIAIAIANYGELEQDIIRSILPGGEISDNASSALSQIRRQRTAAQLQVKSRLEGIIRSSSYQKYLQEAIVTIRENRYVIPVKQESRSQVPGIVHDQSASGATLFIEPMAVVEANNELRRLQSAEKQEIQRILWALSSAVGAREEDLLVAMEALASIDFIVAKARYSREMDAVGPQIVDKPVLDIIKGRHPLLGAEVVPVSLNLGMEFDTLVITGPNTGGKTVTLKTAGLIILMAQSGLHVPADQGTRVGIFNQVFADIGDEQSIEQSLSTFSSHMTNIVGIMKSAGPGSLVLLDELGAGTDPAEGAALAQAILENLHNKGAGTVATTHYSELKNFAFSTPGVENASVEFDPVTLRPTYRLLIGKPGRSNAFEIAVRLGLDRELVERSRNFLSVDQLRAADLMDHLEKARHQAEADKEEAARLRLDAGIYFERYRKMEAELASRRESLLAKARDEARSRLKNARAEAEEIIRQLRETPRESCGRERENAIQSTREKMSKLQEKVFGQEERPRQNGTAPLIIKAGQEIFLPRYNQNGFVVSEPQGDRVQVQVGMMKVFVPLSDVRAFEGKKKAGSVQSGGILTGKAKEVSTTFSMRGMTADEALEEMEKYLDDAFCAGLPKVYLVHGKGTGVLRSVVQRELKGHPRVKSFRLGEHGEGGSGVTVVELQ